MTITKHLRPKFLIILFSLLILGGIVWYVRWPQVITSSAILAPTTLEELTAKSDTIVEGVVTKKHLSQRERDPWNGTEEIITTRWTVHPERTFRRQAGNDDLIVKTLGGQVGFTIMDAEDQPEFAVGQRVLVFLRKVDDAYTVVGWAQGAYTIERGPQGEIARVHSTHEALPLPELVDRIDRAVKSGKGVQQ